MSAKQMGRVWDYEFDRAEQSIMLALADHADHEGGSIYPSMSKIAWKTGYSRRHVIRIVKRLRESGILVLVREAQPEKHMAAEYRIDWNKAEPKEPFTPSDTVSRGDTPSDMGVRGASDMGVTTPSDIAMSPQPSEETSLQPSQPNGDGRFAKACAAYEDNIGMLTPMVSEEIQAAVDEYPDGWLVDAIRIAAEANARNLRYVKGILRNWDRQGYQDTYRKNGSEGAARHADDEFGGYHT